VVLVPYVLLQHAKVGMKVTSSIFFLTKYNYSYFETYIPHKYMVHHLQSWHYFSTKSPSSSTHFFPLLRETLYDGRVKPHAEASELLTHTLSQFVVPKNGVIGVHNYGVLIGGSRRVLSRDCTEDEGEQIQSTDF